MGQEGLFLIWVISVLIIESGLNRKIYFFIDDDYVVKYKNYNPYIML